MSGGGARGWAGLVPALVLLAGCDTTVQEVFGIGKRAPDEFQIVRRQPLIMPPDVQLRPPRPGAPGQSQESTSTAARELLTGTGTTPAPSTLSPGEQALLSEAKAPTDPDIRAKLLEESTELAVIDDSRFLIILDWQLERMQPQGDPLNAAAEAERLSQEGVVVTGPVTVRTSSSPLPPSGSGS